MTFDDLKLAPAILKAVREQGYETPTPIQAQAIPAVLDGHDLLAGAQTGTGKTAAFTLPMLHKLSKGQCKTNKFGKDGVAALVLTPTRELAAQVEESIRTYGKYLPLTSTVIFGGVGMNPQIDRIRGGVDILVATPGRLLDLHQQGHLDLSTVEILVLDEADRMLDMGFLPDVKKILALVPREKQSLLFSATFSDEIRELAHTLLRDCVRSLKKRESVLASRCTAASMVFNWRLSAGSRRRSSSRCSNIICTTSSPSCSPMRPTATAGWPTSASMSTGCAGAAGGLARCSRRLTSSSVFLRSCSIAMEAGTVCRNSGFFGTSKSPVRSLRSRSSVSRVLAAVSVTGLPLAPVFRSMRPPSGTAGSMPVERSHSLISRYRRRRCTPSSPAAGVISASRAWASGTWCCRVNCSART